MPNRRKRRNQVDDRSLRFAYKGGRCTICGKSVAALERRYCTSHGAFHFNHIDPEQKDPNFENLIRRNISDVQLDELDKCNILCGVCHGIWHGQNLRGDMNIGLTLKSGLVVEEQVPIHGLFDFLKPKIYLFSDNPSKLEVYAYRLGTGELVTMVGRDLEKVLMDLMRATRREGCLRVYDDKGPVFGWHPNESLV
jgi:hypothetical protein